MSEPEQIVYKLLEDQPPEDQEPELDAASAKAWLQTHGEDMLNKFEQIGGDYGDPWLYGGSWHNHYTGDIVHINGLEGEGVRERHYDDEKLTPEELAAIYAQFPKEADDPQVINDNERDRDEAIDALKLSKYEAREANQKLPVYRFCDEEIGEDEWPDQISIRSQFDPGVYDEMPTAQKWLEIGQYHGFHELDHYPDSYTKAELSKYLGVEL